MPTFLDKAKVQFLLWKLTLLLMLLFLIDATATAIVSVMIDAQWEALNGTQKFLRICLVCKAAATAMIAFFTNSARKLANNELPFAEGRPEGGTKQWTRKTETVETASAKEPEK